jgi:hypothetical protein
MCWAIWKTRNKICFEGKFIKHPGSIICSACVLMSCWAGLYAEEDKKALEDEVNTMLHIVVKLLSKKTPNNQLLQNGDEDNQKN